jgi:hypothetical protein
VIATGNAAPTAMDVCLGLAVLFGPAGWLSYIGLAAMYDRRRLWMHSQAPKPIIHNGSR